MPIDRLSRQCCEAVRAQIVFGKPLSFKYACALEALDVIRLGWEGLVLANNGVLQSINVIFGPAGRLCVKVSNWHGPFICQLLLAPVLLPALIAGTFYGFYAIYCRELPPFKQTLHKIAAAAYAVIINPYQSATAIAERHVRGGLVDTYELFDPQVWDLANIQYKPETLNFLEFLLSCPYLFHSTQLQVNGILFNLNWETEKTKLRVGLIQQLMLRENKMYGSQLWDILKKGRATQELDADINAALKKLVYSHHHRKDEGIKNCLALLSQDPMKAVFEDKTDRCWAVLKTDEAFLKSLIKKPHSMLGTEVVTRSRAMRILRDIYQLTDATFHLLVDLLAPAAIISIDDALGLSRIVASNQDKYRYWLRAIDANPNSTQVDDLNCCQLFASQDFTVLADIHYKRAYAKIFQKFELAENTNDTLIDEQLLTILRQLDALYDLSFAMGHALSSEPFLAVACAFEGDLNRKCLSLAELACRNSHIMDWLEGLDLCVPIIAANLKKEVLLPVGKYVISTHPLPSPKVFSGFCLHVREASIVLLNWGGIESVPLSDCKNLFAGFNEDQFKNVHVKFGCIEFGITPNCWKETLGSDAVVELVVGESREKIPVHRSVLSQFGFDKKLDEGTLTCTDIEFAYTGSCSLNNAAEICSFVEKWKPLTWQKIEKDTLKNGDFEIKNQRNDDCASFSVHKSIILGWGKYTALATKIHFQKEVRNVTVRDKEAYQLGDVSSKMCEALVRYLYRDPDFEDLLQLCTSEELSELKKLAHGLQLYGLYDLTKIRVCLYGELFLE